MLSLYIFRIYKDGKQILHFNVQARTDLDAMKYYCQRDDVQSLPGNEAMKIEIEIRPM